MKKVIVIIFLLNVLPLYSQATSKQANSSITLVSSDLPEQDKQRIKNNVEKNDGFLVNGK